jgi:chorismate synthase
LTALRKKKLPCHKRASNFTYLCGHFSRCVFGSLYQGPTANSESMPGNSFGHTFRITTFGESHGTAIGVVIDGCPPGLFLDLDFVQNELDRRRPGQSAIVSQRQEADRVEVLSGVFDGKSTGMPIALLIRNEDAKPKDYSHIADRFRPSHADFTYHAKYGFRDYRGGGRSSARETAARVAAGAVAKMVLQKHGVKITAWVSKVGDVVLEKAWQDLDFSQIEATPVRCPDLSVAEQMEALIREVRKEGDTIGGIVGCVIENCPVGLGEPVFDRLHADLGKAMLSINACKGFEYGSGFAGVSMRGSQHNDAFFNFKDKILTRTNHSGGVQGGISNGMAIDFRVAFKPVATIVSSQESVNEAGESVQVVGRGRHDPCVLPRAVPIVEAMAALVIVDHLLRNNTVHVQNLTQ